MSENHYVVIMAGGIGSRFWPISRTNYPKQFHDVLGVGKTMLQQTAERFQSVCPPENIYVVTNKDYKNRVKEQLPFLSDDQILSEPVGRNTAPCIAYACYKIASRNSDARIVVAPSDHLILKEEVFISIIKEALESANEEVLITLGIKPSRPDTGYGYIQYIDEGEQSLKKVKTFTEKPNMEIAKMFIQSGDFVWNSGIFIWHVKSILAAFEQHLPELSEVFDEGAGAFFTDQEEGFIGRAYAQCRNISIDYGVMEKAGNVYVMLSDFGWSDLGTWNSLYSMSEKDEHSNVISGNVLTYDTYNCIIKTPKDRLVVVQGLEEYIVAEHENVLMICRLEDEQMVKEFVADVKSKKGQEFI